MDTINLASCRFTTILPPETQLLIFWHLEIHEAIRILDTAFPHLKQLYLRYLPHHYNQWFNTLTSRSNLSYTDTLLLGGNSPIQRSDQFDSEMEDLGFSGDSGSPDQLGRLAAMDIYTFTSMNRRFRFPARGQYKQGHHQYLSHQLLQPLAEAAPSLTNAQEAIQMHLTKFLFQAWLPGVWSDIHQFTRCRNCLAGGPRRLTITSAWQYYATRRWKELKLTNNDLLRKKGVLLPLGWDEREDIEPYAVQGLFLDKEMLYDIMSNMTAAFHLGLLQPDTKDIVFHQDVTTSWLERIPEEEDFENVYRMRMAIKRTSQLCQLGTILEIEFTISAREKYIAELRKDASADFTIFSSALRPFGGR
ncbi:hypothetical protein BP6252_07961 [Coleophoma cylindrospora]|uniref:Uncharacterized protein n=1 Tax=Coleophoma cylindrospora TaxID=1849047 RepID=A0A3D8RBV3_9HELO|nr:hypothetical protein BP6252_07961 [Coleophoma cylindrospora]